MFRERDRQAMDFLLDLWDYQDVRDNGVRVGRGTVGDPLDLAEEA
jgi:hypothetical protein